MVWGPKATNPLRQDTPTVHFGLYLKRRTRPSAICGQNKEAILMRKIYVSDSGDDKGDGLTEKTPIRSWQRFIQLCEGNDEIIIMGDGSTGKMRLIAEIDKKGRIAQAEVAPKVS
jgi:hypothetical protein